MCVCEVLGCAGVGGARKCTKALMRWQFKKLDLHTEKGINLRRLLAISAYLTNAGTLALRTDTRDALSKGNTFTKQLGP
jgi:hypothetical protein